MFLDLDGTLIDIAPTPAAATTPDGLVTVLETVTKLLGGALAIVSGRTIADVDRLLDPLMPVAAGIHGAEMRTIPGGTVARRTQAMDADVVAAVYRAAAAEPGVGVELKYASLAVHYRLAPAAGPRIEAALVKILANGPDHLMLCPGRRVLELVPRDVSKGTALEALMALPEFRGKIPVMIGDDVTDQSAFNAAHRFGGHGLRVAGEHFASTDAQFSGPAEVREWLANLARSLAS